MNIILYVIIKCFIYIAARSLSHSNNRHKIKIFKDFNNHKWNTFNNKYSKC